MAASLVHAYIFNDDGGSTNIAASSCQAVTAAQQEGGVTLLNVGGQGSFLIETSALMRSTALAAALSTSQSSSDTITAVATIAKSNSSATILYVEDDVPPFRLALRLMREGKLDAAMKGSKVAVKKALYSAIRYGLPEALQRDLSDRLAALSSIVMPEIAAMLEMNARRKVLLWKQVLKKTQQVDLTSGGAQAIEAKIGRIKISTSLLEAVKASHGVYNRPTGLKMLRLALRIVSEGRTVGLPEVVSTKVEEVVKEIGEELKKEKEEASSSSSSSSTAAAGTVSSTASTAMEIESATTETATTVASSNNKSTNSNNSTCLIPVGFCTRKSSQAPLFLRLLAIASPSLSPNKLTVTNVVIRVNLSGERIYLLSGRELQQQFGCFVPLIVQLQTMHARGESVAAVEIFVGDDAELFDLALHLARTNGSLEAGERGNEGIVRSCLAVVRRYGLRSAIEVELSKWLFAHVNGVGGATTAEQELRALKLTKHLNPGRGDMLVSSAMAEAYLERSRETSCPAAERRDFLQKAEIELRTVLPIMLTSQSVVKIGPEENAAVTRTISMLKTVLMELGRKDEAEQVDVVIRKFTASMAGAAADLSQQQRRASGTNHATMYS